MNEQKQRIAIAEACGWTPTGQGYPFDWRQSLANNATTLPDYLNDLNAMHEAEISCPMLNWPTFIREVAKLVSAMVEPEDEPDTGEFWLVMHATAAQRAEAFLRAIGKWEESA